MCDRLCHIWTVLIPIDQYGHSKIWPRKFFQHIVHVYFMTKLSMDTSQTKIFSKPGFHPSTFCYYSSSPEIELKMQLGVWGHCKLWLKQHSNLLKPLEMALFFGCDKWYSYCIITSNSCSNILLNSWEDPLQSFLLFTTPCGQTSALQHYAIFDCFLE